MPKSNVLTLFDAIHPSNNLLEQSLLAQLEMEGVLSVEPTTANDPSQAEMVRFTFERFSDQDAIAAKLLDDLLNTAEPVESVAQGTPLYDVCFGEKSYRRAGLVEALAIQLPERVGIELPDVCPDEHLSWMVAEAFLESLLWREQSRFTRADNGISRPHRRSGSRHLGPYRDCNRA